MSSFSVDPGSEADRRAGFSAGFVSLRQGFPKAAPRVPIAVRPLRIGTARSAAEKREIKVLG